MSSVTSLTLTLVLEDMKAHLLLCIENLQKVIKKVDYPLEGIARLNIYTTSTAELM
ncbi:RidA family protein [Myroides odoratimimus]|uniref:Uncharacterized protein n=2 Tax=Myroides TaxID=76831 RepID=A0AAV3F1V0_9FLAO|nr:RidA family protein [Myroides odoratimimus]EHO09890.1 hypothetical protein HMPREF9715_02255 [Myroides odoratimimus CIP 101113]